MFCNPYKCEIITLYSGNEYNVRVSVSSTVAVVYDCINVSASIKTCAIHCVSIIPQYSC